MSARQISKFEMRRQQPYHPREKKVLMLGQGTYRLSEVALYAGLPPSTVRAWFKWRSDRMGKGPLFTAEYKSVGGDFAVSFLDLIDAYA